jgi:hypothetical protein
MLGGVPCAKLTSRGHSVSMNRLRITTVAAPMSIALAASLTMVAGASAAISSIQLLRASTGTTSTILHGISCTSADACITVGGPDGQRGTMLVERWDGSRWTIQRTTRPPGSVLSFLDGVSCASHRSCVAVGFDVDRTGDYAALIMRWNGSSWSMARVTRPTGALESVLDAVSCTSQFACTVVGSSETRSGVFSTLVERWNGSRWSVQPTPRLQYSELFGVSCGSARACTAVGVSGGGTELMEHWSGGRWSQVSSPNLTMPENGLNAISCPSSTTCTTVGEQVIPSVAAWPLLASFTNGRWSVQTLRGQPLGVLYAVSCTARTTCTAVGADSLVEHMNGTRWMLEPAPDPKQSNLFGVSCTGKVCVAVGSWIDQSGWEAPLVETMTAAG